MWQITILTNMDYSTITLGTLLSHANETIRRNAMSILKQLQRSTLKKKCLYCDNITNEYPHFMSGCCGRGMCDECYGNFHGTDEQFQIAYMEEEDYEKYIKGTDLENKGDYVCFECVEKKE